jgi:hypothetical protein
VADDAQRHREEGGHEDGPVLVGQQVLLQPRIRGSPKLNLKSISGFFPGFN